MPEVVAEVVSEPVTEVVSEVVIDPVSNVVPEVVIDPDAEARKIYFEYSNILNEQIINTNTNSNTNSNTNTNKVSYLEKITTNNIFSFNNNINKFRQNMRMKMI